MIKKLVRAEWAKKFSAWGDFDLRCAELVREYGRDNCAQGAVHSEVHALCEKIGCPFSVIFNEKG